MPYKVVKSSECPNSKPFAVVKTSGGKPLGCHPSKDKANQQLKALYAQEKSLPEALHDWEELAGQWPDSVLTSAVVAHRQLIIDTEETMDVAYPEWRDHVQRQPLTEDPR